MPKQKIDKKGIIRESLKVFKAKGYANTTMADIGRACGLLKGSIYHYFSSKETLMEEVIRSLHDYYNREVFSIATDPSLNGMEKLQRLAGISEEIFLQEKAGCLMTNIGLETVNVVPRFTQLIRAYFEDWIRCLEHIFRERYPADKARSLAEQSVAEIEGAVILMQLYDDPRFLRQAHKHIIDHYLEMKLQTAERKNS